MLNKKGGIVFFSLSAIRLLVVVFFSMAFQVVSAAELDFSEESEALVKPCSNYFTSEEQWNQRCLGFKNGYRQGREYCSSLSSDHGYWVNYHIYKDVLIEEYRNPTRYDFSERSIGIIQFKHGFNKSLLDNCASKFFLSSTSFTHLTSPAVRARRHNRFKYKAALKFVQDFYSK